MRGDTYATSLSRLRPFEASSATELGTIARSCTIVTRPSGAVLAREGSASREYFVVISGCALVTRGGVPDAALRAGDSFGEADLLAGAVSSTGLIALSDVELLVMSAPEFVGLLDNAPSFRRGVIKRLAERARAREGSRFGVVTMTLCAAGASVPWSSPDDEHRDARGEDEGR